MCNWNTLGIIIEDFILKVFIEQNYSKECRNHPFSWRMSLTVLGEGLKISRESNHFRSEEKEQCSLLLSIVFTVSPNACWETTHDILWASNPT